MYKLPISKYKNATAKVVKKDQLVNGLSTNRLINSSGNLIGCSLDFVAFGFDTTSGGSFGTITHQTFTKKLTFGNDTVTTTHAHTGALADIQFNPLNGSILATSGYDSQINIWSLSDSGAKVSVNQSSTLSLINESRCDNIEWNPNVNNILTSVSLSNVSLWDVENKSVVNTFKNHTDAIQGMSWKRDGSLMVTSSKDKTMQVFDPRDATSSTNLKIENAKTNNKDSRVIWVGQSDIILSSVLTTNHQRELYLWDVRNTAEPCHEATIDSGNNVMLPLLDHDTGMLFLAGRAETAIKYAEINIEASTIAFNTVQNVDDQVKSMCLLPKFGLDLMKCEIDRLILLTRSAVYPLPYFIPRRSYYDFHADVFPETFTYSPSLSTNDWLSGQNAPAQKTTFNPETQKQFNPLFAGLMSTPLNASNGSSTGNILSNNNTASNSNISNGSHSVTKPVLKENNDRNNSDNTTVKPSTISKPPKSDEPENKPAPEPVISSVKIPTISAPEDNTTQSKPLLKPSSSMTDAAKTGGKPKSMYYQSKFKYIAGKIAHKSEHITNIRNLSTMWPAECNGFSINSKRGALLIGSSGQIGVIELNQPGRLPDTQINTIVNKSKVSDFAWDPFDDETLAVACDDGMVKIWKIPPKGLSISLEQPEIELRGHLERLYCIKYHPYAKNVIASASYDRTIKLWNIETATPVRSLTGSTDAIFNMSWSPCGNKLAAICKDGSIRIYEPLVSESPILDAKVGPPSGSKGARIEWALNGRYLLVSGFGKGNSRQLYLFKSDDLTQLHVEDINQSPSLLIPYYDIDINVVYLYAKGEETVFLYEIQEDAPYLQSLTPYKPEGGLHFALAFLPKQSCDIKGIEIARAYRLTKDSRIESISFTVPRVKQSLFQDDIFPDTIDKSKPYVQADEWFASKKFELNYVNLQPADMQKLSEILAKENEESSLNPKKEVKKPVEQRRLNGMLDEDNFGDAEKKIINSMLQRASLYKTEADTDEEDDETNDWQ